ncbi:MAG: Fe-S protein assembly co-chaperone HscB [Nitrospirae bacterium]|nr:Fe-S protein assembly co-chaperone HscB [Nitrospirota bacterium]
MEEKHETDDVETERGMKVKCLTCGSPQEGFFCGDCHSLLPLSPEADYFTLLGVERRPKIDEDRLRERFVALSQKVHPDRHFNESTEIQEASLTHSSLANRAYQTLKDPRERLKYLLSLETGAEVKETSKASMEILGFYMEAGDVCQEAETLVKKGMDGRKEEAAHLIKKLGEFRSEARAHWLNAMKRLEEVDREWMVQTGEEGRKKLLQKVELLANDLSYLTKLQVLIDQQILNLS